MCLTTLLPILFFLSCTVPIFFLSLFALHQHYFSPPSPPSQCNVSCAAISDQAEASLALPHLLLDLLAAVTRHLPRYVAACLAWLWPIGLTFLVLPVSFVALLYGTALLVRLYILRHWLVGEFGLFFRPHMRVLFINPVLLLTVFISTEQALRVVIS